MVVLLETKMTDHKHLIEELKFNTHIQSAANGISSGIVIVRKDIVKLDSLLSLLKESALWWR